MTAISQDMMNWQPLGIVLAPNPNNSWEAGRILAGRTYQENGFTIFSIVHLGQVNCLAKNELRSQVLQME